jgi:hypothetical protein
LGDGVFNAWQKYDEACFSILLSPTPPAISLFGIYGRLPTQALKVAICLAVADWDGADNAPTIEIQHWARAQLIAERWRASAHQLYYTLAGITEVDTTEQRILNRVAAAGEGGITLRDLYRAERKQPEEIEPVMYRLVREGLLNEFRPDGRKTVFYQLSTYVTA